MPARHEMPRTWSSGRLDQKLSVGTNRLKTMMLDDHRLPREKPEKNRRQRGSRHMNDIASAIKSHK